MAKSKLHWKSIRVARGAFRTSASLLLSDGRGYQVNFGSSLTERPRIFFCNPDKSLGRSINRTSDEGRMVLAAVALHMWSK